LECQINKIEGALQELEESEYRLELLDKSGLILRILLFGVPSPFILLPSSFLLLVPHPFKGRPGLFILSSFIPCICACQIPRKSTKIRGNRHGKTNAKR